MAHPRRRILLLDGFDVCTATVTERLRALGLEAVRAKAPDEALGLAGEDTAIAAVWVPSDLPEPDVRPLVALLRAAATGRSLTLLVVGPRPGPDACRAFREAGIALALWEPFDDAVLRFQANRTLAAELDRRPRRALRAPCGAPVRAHAGGREKPGRLYTISERGAYLETGRASMKGAEVFIDFQLGSRFVQAEGRVVSSNVPGNLRDRALPVGIAVEFTRLSEGGEDAIRRTVEETQGTLEVPVAAPAAPRRFRLPWHRPPR